MYPRLQVCDQLPRSAVLVPPDYELANEVSAPQRCQRFLILPQLKHPGDHWVQMVFTDECAHAAVIGARANEDPLQPGTFFNERVAGQDAVLSGQSTPQRKRAVIGECLDRLL